MFAEQHHAQKSCFKKKRGEYFITQQGSCDVAGFRHKTRPVGAKLETHRDTGYHTYCKRERKNLDPEQVGVFPVLITGQCESCAEIEQHPAQTDRDRRKQNMETDVGGKLDTCQQQGIKIGHEKQSFFRYAHM